MVQLQQNKVKALVRVKLVSEINQKIEGVDKNTIAASILEELLAEVQRNEMFPHQEPTELQKQGAAKPNVDPVVTKRTEEEQEEVNKKLKSRKKKE